MRTHPLNAPLDAFRSRALPWAIGLVAAGLVLLWVLTL